MFSMAIIAGLVFMVASTTGDVSQEPQKVFEAYHMRLNATYRYARAYNI